MKDFVFMFVCGENVFNMFSTLCSLSDHHAKSKVFIIMREEQKKVLEVSNFFGEAVMNQVG